MDNGTFLKEMIRRADVAQDGYFQYAHVIATLIDPALMEQLSQLVSGPVEDGDVISKSQRNELMYLGLAKRICCNGRQGYTGATYLAHTVLTAYARIAKGEVGA
jgi:hypothetical protein